MKTKLTTLILFLSVSSLFAQERNGIFDKQTPITWMGIDFTGAYIIGDGSKFPNDEAVYNFMTSLNELMIDEASKYSIKETFDKSKVNYALAICKKHNAQLKADALLTSESEKLTHFTPELVQEIISRYDFQDKSGIGLMLNIEAFSKIDEQGSMWFTFFDIQSKKVLITERVLTSPGGIGIRNYWAGSIYAALKHIQKKELSNWRKKYYQGS